LDEKKFLHSKRSQRVYCRQLHGRTLTESNTEYLQLDLGPLSLISTFHPSLGFIMFWSIPPICVVDSLRREKKPDWGFYLRYFKFTLPYGTLGAQISSRPCVETWVLRRQQALRRRRQFSTESVWCRTCELTSTRTGCQETFYFYTSPSIGRSEREGRIVHSPHGEWGATRLNRLG
jgi:hypothetical protein